MIVITSSGSTLMNSIINQKANPTRQVMLIIYNNVYSNFCIMLQR